jgi:hypothetical protein
MQLQMFFVLAIVVTNAVAMTEIRFNGLGEKKLNFSSAYTFIVTDPHRLYALKRTWIKMRYCDLFLRNPQSCFLSFQPLLTFA